MSYFASTGGLGNPDATTRINYYNVTGYPTLVWNGTIKQVGAGTDVINGLPYRSLIMSLLDEPSHFKLTVNSVSFSVPMGSIDLDIEVMESLADVSNMVLRMSLQEDHVDYGGDMYEDVTRDMLPDVPITVNSLGQVQNVNMPFTVDAGWAEGNLEIVAFIQDDTDKKVHATATTRPGPDYSLRFYSLGERQVVGPTTGAHNYGNFRVYNFGNFSDTYTVDLTGTLPDGWTAGICDEVQCFGLTYSELLAPGEYMELHVMIEPAGTGYAQFAVEMREDNLAFEFPRALNYGYFTDDLDVLLVDDDGAETYETYFIDALTYNGYTYGVWDRSAGAASAATLGEFPVIVWNVGWNFPTLDEDDRAALGDYMDAGGSLFITGQDIGWELNDIGGAAYLWYRTYLHALYIADDTNDYTLSGVPGDPVSSGIDLVIQGGDGANNQEYPSDIDPADASASVIWTYDANRNGAVRADTGTYRVIYLAFGYEAIDNPTDRRDVMGRSLNWLTYGPIAVEPSVTRPPALLTSAPNPASARATLRFSLPTAGETNLMVYRPDGRLVETLVQGPMDAGPHAVVWDFTDARGNRLPAGVYFYRLRGEGVDMTRKLLLVK